ncbi:MAG: NUDIX hydrolase [Oscillospiraceae bacterium]|nr:NUDIX hydrolase [Oscillospiraceae bacterium]
MVVTEKKIKSAEIYNGHIIKVFKDEVSLEDAGCAIREVVRHKGAAAILAVSEKGEAYFVEQFRYPVGTSLFEAPAGKIDDGEAPIECAKRELLEECGITAEKWTELGPMLSSPGFCDEVIHLYLAENLSESKPDPDDDEFLDIIKIPLCEARDRLRKGEIPDAKTQILILRGCDILGI